MRIAVSTDDPNGLDGVVSPHFGRCPFFTLVEIEGNEVREVRAVENPFYQAHQPGQVPAFIHSLGADVMLTGGMGGRAVQFFQQVGIEPVTGAMGTVRQALEGYLGGALRGAAPCQESVEHGHGQVPPEGAYERDEVGRLREEVALLQRQLREVEDRLRRLG
ncbi:MAG: NifB/NifX family molybdenum-iron cluster-binding protein [Anaerolineae bacterium]|nr:NifB/NifX family molybdenum-iron cluster-binding protein [Anaerolineae bacterium]